MSFSIDVADPAWSALSDLAGLTRNAGIGALALLDGVEAAVTVRFTDDAEIAALNARWRGKAGPTNVLSFPAAPGLPVPPGEARHLGDIALAFGTVSREAAEQGKSLAAHTSHLIVHACLHLAGHDHGSEAEAAAMEALEKDILANLGIADPHERS